MLPAVDGRLEVWRGTYVGLFSSVEGSNEEAQEREGSEVYMKRGGSENRKRHVRFGRFKS